MRAFTAIIAISLASIAAAATTPARRDLPGQTYPEPGLIHCRTDDCSGTTEGDDAECLFLEYKWLPPGGGGKCLGTSVFRSVISYTPENVTTLPYDIYVDKIYSDGPCGNPASATVVKLTELNTCVKLTDDSKDAEFEFLFKDPS